MGEAEEYRWRRGALRGAGDAGLDAFADARPGRGDAGAELLSRSSDALVRRLDFDASRRSASCSNEPGFGTPT